MTTGTNQEVYTNDQTDAETGNQANAEATLAHWEKVLQDEGLSPIEADGLTLDAEQLYLGISGTTVDGVDLQGDAEVELPAGETDEEITPPVGETRPVLLPEDFELLQRLHSKGEALTLDEAQASPESIVRLAGAGFANGRIPEEGDVVVLATATATDHHVWRAVNRARCDVMEAGFLADIAECERVASKVLGRVERLGGAVSERALVESLIADHPREAIDATLAELTRREAVRRTVSRTSGVRLVADPKASGQTLVGTVRNLVSLAYQGETNGRRRGKTFAGEASGSRPNDDVAQVPERTGMEAAFAEFLRARGGSLAVAESKAEIGRIERKRARMRAEFIERRGSGRELIVTPAAELDSRYDRRRSRQARKRNFWSRVSAKALANPEKMALDTARAVLRNLGVDPEALTKDERRRALLTVLAGGKSGIRTTGRLAAAVSGFKAALVNAHEAANGQASTSRMRAQATAQANAPIAA